MKNSMHINSQDELEKLIERYFDGETTVQEERTLRQALADCPWRSESIDEARFTLGYFAEYKQRNRRVMSFNTRHRLTSIAASIAICLAVGGYALWHQYQSSANECIAYVNGKAITSDDAVMALIEKDLNTMDNASNSMAAQLSSIGESLELDNN